MCFEGLCVFQKFPVFTPIQCFLLLILVFDSDYIEELEHGWLETFFLDIQRGSLHFHYEQRVCVALSTLKDQACIEQREANSKRQITTRSIFSLDRR